MKATKLLFVAVLMLGSQFVSAESYQRWIYWVDSTHIATASEMAEIITTLSQKKILADSIYAVSNGVNYRVPNPDLYLEYIIMCVKSGEPSIKTIEDVIQAVNNGDVVLWGNDIPYRVKNYYFSKIQNGVRPIPDYSGAEKSVPVLLINGKPKIKMDCGNPLEPYLVESVPPSTSLGSNSTNKSSTGAPVIVNVTNTNTNDFGPLIEALGKLNPTPTQQTVDLKLPKGVKIASYATAVTLLAILAKLIFWPTNKNNVVDGEPGGARKIQ